MKTLNTSVFQALQLLIILSSLSYLYGLGGVLENSALQQLYFSIFHENNKNTVVCQPPTNFEETKVLILKQIIF